jgi:hypothetical protein
MKFSDFRRTTLGGRLQPVPGEPIPGEPRPDMPPDPDAPPKYPNGLAGASFALGLLSLALCLLLWLPLLLGVLAIGLGICAIVRAKRGLGQRGLAIAGVATGALGIAVAVCLIIWVTGM